TPGPARAPPPRAPPGPTRRRPPAARRRPRRRLRAPAPRPRAPPARSRRTPASRTRSGGLAAPGRGRLGEQRAAEAHVQLHSPLQLRLGDALARGVGVVDRARTEQERRAPI